MQKLHFFFDDSGVLTRNSPSTHFIYAGYSFIGDKSKEDAKRRYMALARSIAKELGREDELKACNLDIRHKRALYNVLKYEQSMHASVEIDNVYDSIINTKKSTHRYKDYSLKLLIKKKINQFISSGLIDSHEDVFLNINVDEQGTATDGIYSLRESINEELIYGISNFNYGMTFKPILFGKLILNVQYCDSKCNHLIQASDILANRIWTSHILNKCELRDIPNHLSLNLP